MKTFFIISSAFFLSILTYYQPLQSFKYRPPVKLELPFEKIETKKIMESIVLGKKKLTGDQREIKKIVKELNLQHILTPSGLHLSSALLFLKFFPKLFLMILTLGLACFLFFNENLFSLQRNLTLYLTKSFFPLPLDFLFFAIIFLELIFCDWSRFQSLAYSYLFLGTIIIYRNQHYLKLIEKLCLAQLIILSLKAKSISILIFPLNFLTTFLTTLFFPGFLASSLISFLGVEFIGDFLARNFVTYLKFIFNIYETDPFKMNSQFFLCLYLLLKLMRKRKIVANYLWRLT